MGVSTVDALAYAVKKPSFYTFLPFSCKTLAFQYEQALCRVWVDVNGSFSQRFLQRFGQLRLPLQAVVEIGYGFQVLAQIYDTGCAVAVFIVLVGGLGEA